jgi:Methyltransferase domain
VKAPDVRRELLAEQSPELLKELHLLTRDGHLNADALRKLKQVNHLVGLLRPALDDIFSRFGDPVLVDAGSGNAYLGFVLYELFLKPLGKGTLLCIESRPELTAQAAERAQRLSYDRMRFVTASLDRAPWPGRPHLVVALHACDTATDDALLAGLSHNADYLAVVPCCQAEVARQLKEHPPRSASLAALAEHPMHRREFGSHLTNVLRALVLEAHGYAVTVTELTGWEHSLKNELLLAKKVRREDAGAKARLELLLAETGVAPKLVRVLRESLAVP